MAWNNNFTMQDLFMNPALKNVVPQFGRREPVQQVYSFAEQTRQIKEHLRGLLKATKTVDGDLRVKGEHAEVMRKVEMARTTIEQMFNSMPSLSKNLHANTRVYLPYATQQQMADMTDFESKIAVLRAILQNCEYNDNFKSQGRLTRDLQIPNANYTEAQRRWKKTVGWRG